MARTPTAAKPKSEPRTRRASTRKPETKPPQTPVLEWVAATVGLLATAAVTGVIGWELLTGGDTPPDIRVALKQVAALEDGYVAEIEVVNRGERPAAQVTVEGVLTPNADGQAETSDAVFDYVPDGSARTGGLFFKTDPRLGDLELRAKGFVEP